MSSIWECVLDHYQQACGRKRDGTGGGLKKTEGELAVIGVGEASSEDKGVEDNPIGYIRDGDLLAMSARNYLSREDGTRGGALYPGQSVNPPKNLSFQLS